MQPEMNSPRFTCTLLQPDPELEERVTVLTLRRTQFPQAPLILTATELAELASLIQRWLPATRRNREAV